MKMFLSKKIQTNDKETAVLAILNGMYNNSLDHANVSISYIGREMTGRFLKSSVRKERTIIDSIKEAVQSLIDKNIIEVLDQDKDSYVLSEKGLIVNTEKELFVVIEQWEMQKIFQYANKPFNVFSFFCQLVGTINSKTKEWHMSQDEMASYWKYGKQTVNDYMRQLEDMQIIYVYRSNKRRTNGTYQNINNSYGRYEDKDLIIANSQEYINKIECENCYNGIDRRSIKQRYNAFCKGSKKYQDNSEAIESLYKECISYNKSLEHRPVEGNYGNGWELGKSLDLSVFPDNIIKSNSDLYSQQWGEQDPHQT